MTDDQHMMEVLAERYPGQARKARTGSRSCAIQLFCKQCMGGSLNDVKECQASQSCELWPYRAGGFESAGTTVTKPDPDKSALARARFQKGKE